MLLDIIDNLPRLRLSTAHFKLILWLLNQAGVQHVPSYDAFRKTQQELTKMCASEPVHCVSSTGNHFYVNDPRETIKRQFANPEVAQHFNFYPEETSEPISEVWQAERWKEYDPSDLTPMYSSNGKQFYINEVSMLHDDRLVIPLLWVKRHGILHADCNLVDIDDNGLWIRGTSVHSIPADQFVMNYLEVISTLNVQRIPWKDEMSVPEMPNPKRKLVDEDEDLYVVMIPIWADDVSGNKSKQYNKHINLYMENSNLPARLLQQEYFVNFLSTSPHASSPEQFAEIRKIVNETQTNPIRCFNADTKRRCGVILRVPSLPADNPQQSEEASHIGGNSNKFCRRCHVGGTHEEKESNEGYHSLFSVGISRSASETIEILEKQLNVAMTGVASHVKAIQTETGVKDKVTEYWIEVLLKRANQILRDNPSKSRQELSVELTEWLELQPGDKMSPLLSVAGLDPTKDTPVEILHTILLGIVKYVWHMFHSKLSEEEQRVFTARLQSTDTDGLTIPALRAAYIMQYRNGLIGKHFKALMQTMAFHVHDLVTPDEFEIIKAVGELGAMLWVPKIIDMNEYLNDLEVRIANILNAFSKVDPNKITCKIKLHLLPHIISDCRRYGPAIHNSTEIFECFNAVFRMCSILSNHQAPSRDIARKFASMDRIKHLLSGGYWIYKNEWIQASRLVRRLLRSDVVIQQHLGWTPPPDIQYGKVIPLSKPKSTAVNWRQTHASSVCLQEIKSEIWNVNRAVVAQSGDICVKGSWVACQAIGRLIEILSPQVSVDSDPAFVLTIENFILGENRHPHFDMPVLHRPAERDQAPDYIVIKPEEILFRLSVQHDCRLTGCMLTGSRIVLQEHQKTSQRIAVLSHADDSSYIVNTHALHNATLLRCFLPRSLVEPKSLIPSDRQSFHFEVATKLRAQQDEKRKTTSEKRKATREANKLNKEARRAEMDDTEVRPSVPSMPKRRRKTKAGKEGGQGEESEQLGKRKCTEAADVTDDSTENEDVA
ncbi:hypothetical protein K435DRAFT_671003 [Dendrothele bispora CBS 962.96]|uniref:Uncharacterized protein n=1 Tax=Dendrothele bispora (strain CBS 962.96) TaxID=1314807 RepID=A0A4S8LUK7_DENBC|nr:hypothetical protein K435DRAFT_671003 [Dendrothele bispora CBS 962.96]